MTEQFSSWKSTDKDKAGQQFSCYTSHCQLLVTDAHLLLNFFTLQTVREEDLDFFMQINPWKNSTFL